LALRPVERLPEDLVNKIAAGEVVERPASVVKELVENALDADARSVHVEIEDGGKSLIRVRDDGHGMNRADAERALERHATSKLRTLLDLQSIASHGFRGEALPSIASVAELVLRTRDERSVAATEVAVGHGRLRHVRDAGHPRGTTVEVRDLFGAVPARRKFLKADSTEASHVAEVVTLLALARPGVGFFLRSGERTLVEAPSAQGLGPRVFQIFGDRFLDGLSPVDGGTEWAAVQGFVSRADGPRPSRPNLRLFVNHRPVRDRALVRAVAEAYRGAGTSDRGFEAILFVDVPPHLVDVNVHPAKTEVRFADGRTVWTAVERAVRRALSGASGEGPEAQATTGDSLDRGPAARAPGGGGRSVEGVEGAVQAFFARSGLGDPTASHDWPPGPPSGAERVAEAPAGEAAAPLVLGQHRLTYIVASDGEDLLLVDQHSAHERVRFEQLIGQVERRAVESQRLLVPLVHELPPELRPVQEANAEALAALGYEVEGFGGGSTRVRGVPALLGTRDPGLALERLLRDLLERESGDWIVSGVRDRLAATLACHSAVRAGQGLTALSMTAIVRDLLGTNEPLRCPHGRPTLVRMPREDVSRWFGRTGWRRQ
jgi:DNA mismatch repair protein MutL